jgi:hypothetical protein
LPRHTDFGYGTKTSQTTFLVLAVLARVDDSCRALVAVRWRRRPRDVRDSEHAKLVFLADAQHEMCITVMRGIGGQPCKDLQDVVSYEEVGQTMIIYYIVKVPLVLRPRGPY